jgi:hypothetical protein
MVTNLTPGSDNPSRGGRGDGVSGRRVDERGPGPGVAQQYRSTRTARTRNARIRDDQTLLAATIYGEPNCNKNTKTFYRRGQPKFNLHHPKENKVLTRLRRSSSAVFFGELEFGFALIEWNVRFEVRCCACKGFLLQKKKEL